MQTKIIVDMLTVDSVSIITQQIVNVNGTDYPVGDNHRRAYVNSVIGREQISQELPQPYLSAVMAVWGENPTVIE